MTERYVLAHGLAGEAVARVLLNLPMERIELHRTGEQTEPLRVWEDHTNPARPISWADSELAFGEMVANYVYEVAQQQCLSEEDYASVDDDADERNVDPGTHLTSWIEDERFTDEAGEEYGAWCELARARAVSLAYGYTPEITVATRHLLFQGRVAREEIARIIGLRDVSPPQPATSP